MANMSLEDVFIHVCDKVTKNCAYVAEIETRHVVGMLKNFSKPNILCTITRINILIYMIK